MGIIDMGIKFTDLNEEEKRFISRFRDLTEDEQKKVIEYVRRLAKSEQYTKE
ncbi:MAG: hypothetical protein J6A59_10210 [Lachnospiraceae bacterium]|nr:hypothetical protein [Lachnospiraceae bacterium]